MSVISTGASGGLYAKALTDVLGIGATINAAGQFVAATGPEIRRVTATPNGTISDFGGSLALDVTNGALWVNTATNNVAGTVWRLAALGGSSNGVSRLFSSVVNSTPIVGNAAVQYFDVNFSVPANTLVAGSTLRITGSVIRTGQNGAETITIQTEFGTQIFSGVVAVNAPVNTRCYFDTTITSRAAPGAAVACAGAGSVTWSSLATSAGGALPNLATNGALVVRVGCNMPASAGNTAVLEQLVVTLS
jgi:hypothetical protein